MGLLVSGFCCWVFWVSGLGYLLAGVSFVLRFEMDCANLAGLRVAGGWLGIVRGS